MLLTGTGDTLFLLTPGDSDLTVLDEDEEELLGEGLRLPFCVGEEAVLCPSAWGSKESLFMSDPSPLAGIGFTTLQKLKRVRITNWSFYTTAEQLY